MIDAWLAPIVIALRLPRLADEATRLALGQGRGKGLPEAERMVQEKLKAFQNGLFAAGLESMTSGLAMGMAVAMGKPFDLAEIAVTAPRRVTEAALAPANITMRANAKRLRRR